VIALSDETSYTAATANAALYGWIFALMAALEAENRAQGLSDTVARQVVAGTFRAAAGVALHRADEGLKDILAGLATEGGITAQGLEVLNEKGSLDAWRGALARISARLARGEG
jgi:pyrroline-5-carboxylate reductase